MSNTAILNEDHLDQVTGGSVVPCIVKAGESLEEIAQRYHVTVEQIKKWNGLDNTGILKVGQQLRIKY